MRRLLVMLLLSATGFAVEATHLAHKCKILNVTGPVQGREGDFRLDLHGNLLTIENKRLHRKLDIASEQIAEVLYTPVRYSRVEQNPIPVSSGGCYGQGCGGEVLLYLAAALVLAPMHGHSHYVRITWTDRNVEQQLQFEIGKNDYLPLLESLKQFGGVKYRDVEEEARQVRHELDQNASRAIAIQFEHASRFGVYDLNAGAYRLIALDHPDGKSDMYLLAGSGKKLDLDRITAVARATSIATAETNAIQYDGGSSRILTIIAEGRAYRIEPLGSPPGP